MIRLIPLPPIALTNNQPAFYDVESVTAVEMTSKMYAYLQNMVTDYNSFITEVNNELDNFEKSTNKNYDEFTKCVKDLMDNYIQSVDTKIDLQNKTINDAIKNQDKKIADTIKLQNNDIQNAVYYMKDNLVATVNEIFSSAIENGKIKANLKAVYDSDNESLTFTIQGTEEGE